MPKLLESLNKIFQKERIVFWYDSNAEFVDRFESMELSNVEKIKIENNEFGLKYQVVNLEPNKKFLIYSDKPKPEDSENWLLDLNLAYYEFSAERSSLLLQELGLSIERKPFLNNHIDFFNSKKRLDGLKEILNVQDSDNTIALKMISVITNTQPDLEYILFELFSDQNGDLFPKFDELTKFNLDSHLWRFIEKKYNYRSATPTIKDFLLGSFSSVFNIFTSIEQPTLNNQVLILLNHWADNAKYLDQFEVQSNRAAIDLNIKDKIEKFDYRELLDFDAFELIDKKIIQSLIKDLKEEKISYDEANEILRKRNNKFWYPQYSNIYESIKNANQLINSIKNSDLMVSSLKDGIERYVDELYKIDLYYRKYIYHSNKAEHIDVLKSLTEIIENIYSNSFLLKLSDNWQKQIDTCKEWSVDRIKSQRDFYEHYVKSYTEGDKKIYIIISDALRYESAVELHERLLTKDRFQSEISFMLGMLPSYTQLGMAALLPNQKLSFNDQSSSVYVDDKNSSSTNRSKILQSYSLSSVAVQAKDLLLFSRDEGREFVKKYNVFYIYHNSIDATGDNFKTENEVFNKTEEAFEELEKIIKQITNFNGTNIIITGDHGYIYQNKKLEESDFCKIDDQKTVYISNRRFLIGKDLYANNSVKKFTAKELMLNDDTEFLIAKSINRIRVQGGGNRYVHGGATLQEVIIPVIQFTKKRVSDVKKVDVAVIKSPAKITSNQIAISFYQTEVVEEKVLSIELKIGFYTKDDKLISDEIRLTFNSTNEDARAREQKHRFLLKSEAVNFNNDTIYLKLQEPIEGTNKFKLYKQDSFLLNISFSSEFDDF